MTTQRKAIETRYMGVTFRSRLEAEWALNLNMWGIVWSYEPGGFTLPSGRNYLPDFWLPEIRTWLEVKGPGVSGRDKAEEFATTGWTGEEWQERGENFVIAHAPIGERASFEVACRYCPELIPNRWRGHLSRSFVGACGNRHVSFCTEHGGIEAAACGMDSRCWTCGEKTTQTMFDGSFHRLRWTKGRAS